MKGLRQAALCLHGLNEHDRKWLLKQLPAVYRNALKGLLRELNQIGVPRGQSWVATVKERMVENDVNLDYSDGSMQMLKIIDSAPLSQIKTALLDEPEVVLATILSIYQWSWKDELLRAFNLKKRKSIEKSLQENATKKLNTKVEEILLTILFEKIQGRHRYNSQRNNSQRKDSLQNNSLQNNSLQNNSHHNNSEDATSGDAVQYSGGH